MTHDFTTNGSCMHSIDGRSTPRRVRPLALLVSLSLALTSAACGGRDAAPAAADGHAPESAATGDSAGRSGDADHATDRVTLREEAYRTAQIATELVALQRAAVTGESLDVPGEVQFDPRRVALISPRIPGRIERLTVVDGDRVAAGQTVAFLYGATYLSAQNDYLQSRRRVKALVGSPDEEGARAIAEAAERRLRLAGASEREVRRLEQGGEVADFLALAAPIAGSIIETMALSGAAVEAGSPVFKVADLSVVDVIARVPERALASVHVRQGATVRIAAYPAMAFKGHVERLHDQLEPETRTVDAVIHVANGSRILKPGMFATVMLDVPVRAALPDAGGSVMTIPESALVNDGETHYVFIEVAPRTFERREVRVASLAPAGSASSTSGRVAVRHGLSAGERIVVRGAFVLKSELAKAAFAEDEH